ncbi:VWA domain-containing protein [Haloplanus salinus]|uniref:VWA domain-containing protein n=1 Tax=Haloplanus salinus TaxID=1126245 RepID=A0A368N4H3_9EURY|nr:vWA domain-containing protein [Haloplanus salinus]RCU44474.1 VWA domain-containing protein [Haloplanus salinus]
MSDTNSSVTSNALIETFTPDIHARVRASAGRADRLQAFLQGHLPAGVEVKVVLTPAVQTAAVLPADVDALVSSDATDLERRQAAQLLDGIDEAFLVLVTTAPAPLERVPLNDQLTADHAHQFGLAFHELLHILKTAIAPIAALLDAEVDPKYHQHVHELINIVEDGAIEHEAIHGANFSETAEIRLELTRRIHSQTPDDLGDGQQARLSFWDAVTTALYDAAVYPTGTTEVLLDGDDDRVGFVSEADEIAFRSVQDELTQLAADALAIRGVDLDDATHRHDKTASVERARRVIDTWTSTLQPVVASAVEPTGESQSHGGADSGTDGHDHSPQEDGPTSTPEATGVSVDREATADPYQDVFDHPAMTPDPAREDTDGTVSSPEPDTEDVTGDTASTPVDQKGDEQKRDQEPSIADGDSASRADSSIEPDEEPAEHTSRSHALAAAVERARENRDDSGDRTDPSSPSATISERVTPDDQSVQTPLDAFDVGATATESAETNNLSGPSNDPIPSGEDEQIEHRDGDVETAATNEPEPGPAHERVERAAPSPTEYGQALEHDREVAKQEAAREEVNREAVERELRDLGDVFDRRHQGDENHREDGTETGAGGNGAGPERLDDVVFVPVTDDLVPPGQWSGVEDGAARVAQVLEKELALERQRGTRSGLTAGRYDTRAGHRLAIGDPRVCETPTPGREKRYALVLVLDRSESMRNGSPPKIEVATQAVARLAVAAEELGIRVAIIDFIDGQARLVKPFAVESRHVQTTLLDTDCGGGTPLAEAIGLARTVVETQRDEPLIITVTDDRPSDIEAVTRELQASYAPVCSLTIATDCDHGTLAPDASALAPYYERQAAVYDVDAIDDRLDQFASLLTGL